METTVAFLEGGCYQVGVEGRAEANPRFFADPFPGALDEVVSMTQAPIQDKVDRLNRDLKASGSVMVAFSGGVDSAFLLASAARVLGTGAVTAVTAEGPLFPEREMERASAFCRNLGVHQVRLRFDPFAVEAFSDNPEDRCYLCKQALSTRFLKTAAETGRNRVVHGANLDDLADHRPGLRATREASLEAPLVTAGLRKDEIRRLSREMGLPTWDLPARACLASRIPYGDPITGEALERVDRAERFLEEAGFSQVRVRHHRETARVEVPIEEMPRLLEQDLRERVVHRLRDLGFRHVSLDLEGVVSGSLNRGIL